MRRTSLLPHCLAVASLLSACGGGGSDSSAPSTPPVAAAPTPVAGCSLRERQDWAAAQLREWYLFPETLPAALDPTPYKTVDDYVDALTANARAQRKDRFFTYLTSIAGETAFYNSGSSAGFGFRLAYDPNARRAFNTETFEGTPALAAGIDRGTEILAIGTSTADLRTVDSIITTQGIDGVDAALGPDTAGTTRVLRVTDAGGTRTVTLSKTDFSLTPVSSRYGAQIINDGGRQVGYINLRTFISTADPALRAAFASFRSAGITNVIIDLRYNGGGLLSIAELLTNLLGANRSAADVVDYVTFRPEKASNNSTTLFAPQPQSIAPTKIAFIGTQNTASASELAVAAQLPYLHANVGLIGTNTYGKPVGQIALDRTQCDDRLRVIAFALQNANRQGAYYDGLRGLVEASCQASDDITHPLGSPLESSTRAALDYLAGRSCTPITAAGPAGASAAARGATASSASGSNVTTSSTTASSFAAPAKLELMIPKNPTPGQRQVPGSY